MKQTEIGKLHSDIESALRRASQMDLELMVYILTMAKLELENELDDRKLRSLAELKGALSLQ
jgi:hypothetical protein